MQESRKHAGEALKAARVAKGWSRAQMTIEMHNRCSRTLSAASVGRYERGEVLPRHQRALDLCKCLGVEFDDVFTDGAGVAGHDQPVKDMKTNANDKEGKV